MENPDILIIGAGPAGYVSAIRASQLGKSVLLVEQSEIGGVCLNRGCIPTKALLHYTSIIANAKKALKAGIRFVEPEINFTVFNKTIKNIVFRLQRGIEFLLKGNNVQIVKAHARFVDAKTVLLVEPNGAEHKIYPQYIIIATGSRPAGLAGIEFDNDRIINSDNALEIQEIPKNFVIIGAGAIGLELATIYNRLGSKVTIIEIANQILPNTDTEIAYYLKRILNKQGIEFFLNSKITQVQKNQNGLEVIFYTENTVHNLIADKMLVAVGRIPNVDGLGLENTNIKFDDKQFILTDKNYQCADKIYAIGDIIGPPLLAHKAMTQGIFVAELIAGEKNIAHPRFIPNCVYTDPELATIGITEKEAQDLNYDYTMGKAPLSAIGRAITMDQLEGIVKIIVDKKTDLILGAQILAPEASNLIAELSLAINLNIKSQDLITTMHPHPTLSEAILEAVSAAHNKAIHILNPKNS
ncbi:MAG: dihydrolipoyl dehydrogenase [candidate division WOR-3 bacterium]|nr:dihydrolipoyl dehydrogenase [candidate division WOR-3 bacterium]